MKQDIHIQPAAEVARSLRMKPRQSNNELAQRFGISEGFVSRYRAVLELAGVLPISDSRVGVDGISLDACSRLSFTNTS